MSFTITSSDVIRKHPTNNSTSKEIHMFSRSKRFVSPNPECPNAFYSFDSQLSNRKAAFGYGNKSDFTRTLTVSPPATKYEIKTFLDESKEKGKSFGTTREKLPDNSYLVPQLHKVPGPGFVLIKICSMIMRNTEKETIVSPCVRSLSTSLRKNCHTSNLLDLELISRLTWCLNKEDLRSRSSQILLCPSFIPKLRGSPQSSHLQDLLIMLRETPSTAVGNMCYPIERATEGEFSQGLREIFLGGQDKHLVPEATSKLVSLDTTETPIITKRWDNDSS